MNSSRKIRIELRVALAMGFLGVALVLGNASRSLMAHAGGSAPTIAISQSPLVLAQKGRPQVLIAMGNSESMDGNLSGAIMTGSGSLDSSLSALQSSSSPSTFNLSSATGFTPPLQGADSSGNAPYTVSDQDGNLVDNSPSRLNVAKAGISAIINSFMSTTDFGLESYKITDSQPSVSTTWVYYMSPPSGFSFTNTQPTSGRYVANPCYGVSTSRRGGNISTACSSISSDVYGRSINSYKYMVIDSSSDDPSINDVLYSSGNSPVFEDYNGATSNPYNDYGLNDYKIPGRITVSYNSVTWGGANGTSPTNAGYVPFSNQVMYAQRGFGYSAHQSANSGSVLVNMSNLGQTPTVDEVNSAISQFTPLLAPETNNPGSSEIKAAAGQATTAGMLRTANSYLAQVKSTGSSGPCSSLQYVILISDGLPTEDLQGYNWPPLGSAAATGYGVSATFNSDGTVQNTNDQALIDTISQINALKNANVQTFVIGLGAGVDPTKNPVAANTLTAMAKAGNIAGNSFNYFPASNPQALVNALNTILNAVQAAQASTSAGAVSSTNLNTGSNLYRASFNSADWSGDVQSFAVASSGTPATTPTWSAQALLDTDWSGTNWQNRLVATWDPTAKNGQGAGVQFTFNSLNPQQKAAMQPNDTNGAGRVNYILGDHSQEGSSSTSFRTRAHLLGDIANSQPVYVKHALYSYIGLPSYNAFVQSVRTREGVVYVGANDGMLHAFNAVTGHEIFAYVPNAVIPNLVNLTSPQYTQAHQWFVDGAPQQTEAQFSDGSWHTLLLGGEGGGGKSVYALDITTPDTLTSMTAVTGAVRWEFTDSDMGYSYSHPIVARVNDGATSSALGFAAFFGNGYDSATNKAVLYAVNPQTGAPIAKIDLCAAVQNACSDSLPEGVSSVAAGSVSSSVGAPASFIYAGDLQGNLWAVNVANADPSKWAVRLIFQARDPSGTPQAITTTPYVGLSPTGDSNPFIIFGTGQLLSRADLSTTQTQTLYGVLDVGQTTGYTRSKLQQQTLTMVSAAQAHTPEDIAVETSNSINWEGADSHQTAQYGWYVDMTLAPGQRLLSDPMVLNGGVFVTVNAPPAGGNICSSGFTSWFFDFSYETGGPFVQPQLDILGTGVINNGDLYNNQAPVGMSVNNGGFGSQPINLGVNPTTGNIEIGIGSQNAGGPSSGGTGGGSSGYKKFNLKYTPRFRQSWLQVQ